MNDKLMIYCPDCKRPFATVDADERGVNEWLQAECGECMAMFEYNPAKIEAGKKGTR